MSYRVALLGLYHESNTFLDQPTTLSDFRRGHWLKGEAIRAEYQSAHHEIGGMLEVMASEGIEVVPVLYAEATPGGTIEAAAYDALLTDMMDSLEKILPVDGCLVVPHGAAVSEQVADVDGHWLSLLRKKMGPGIPIMGTLDPHCNISEAMLAATDGLITYKTNPHVDQRQVGREAARLMAGRLQGKILPRQTGKAMPLAISIEQQHTESEPCRSLYALARKLEAQDGILSVSLSLGFPYADVPEMGTSVVVVSDDDPVLAARVVETLEAYIHAHLASFSGRKTSLAEAIGRLDKSKKPVLMLDMGDNVGGGSPGNSRYILEAMEASGQYATFVCLYDPEAVAQAAAQALDRPFTLILTDSGQEVRRYGVQATLLRVSDGRFKESDPRHGGQVNYDMGQTAIVRTERGNVLMLTSIRIPPFSLKQLTSFHIEPGDFDVVVAKGVNAPIAAYGPVCPTILQVDTPGVTQADMTLFTYHHRRKPLFPFEK